MKQADFFLHGEGDAWLNRNRERLGQADDPVALALDSIGIKPKRVLEVGCSNGWRLAALRAKFDCEVFGVEPSMLACIEAAEKRVPVWQMTASTLPEFGAKFDLVIYGFCLYLTDPSDWFNIVAEGDRALAPDGHVVIYDFADPTTPFARPYFSRGDISSYHTKWSAFWLAHPWYRQVYCERTVTNIDQVTVLRKQVSFPTLADDEP